MFLISGAGFKYKQNGTTPLRDSWILLQRGCKKIETPETAPHLSTGYVWYCTLAPLQKVG